MNIDIIIPIVGFSILYLIVLDLLVLLSKYIKRIRYNPEASILFKILNSMKSMNYLVRKLKGDYDPTAACPDWIDKPLNKIPLSMEATNALKISTITAFLFIVVHAIHNESHYHYGHYYDADSLQIIIPLLLWIPPVFFAVLHAHKRGVAFYRATGWFTGLVSHRYIISTDFVRGYRGYLYTYDGYKLILCFILAASCAYSLPLIIDAFKGHNKNKQNG